MKCNSINENKKRANPVHFQGREGCSFELLRAKFHDRKSCFKKKNSTSDVHPTPVTRNYNTNEISQVSVKEIKVITF